MGLEDSDVESRSRASSARGGSTDGGSTRGSISAGAGAMTSRSASSGAEEDLEDERNPFQAGDRSPSTVVFSFDQERQVIEDKVADPDWEQQQRHQKRFSRIRNRV